MQEEEGVDIRESKRYNKSKTFEYQYTEKQYKNYGRVRADNVLSADQYRDFTSRFADTVAKGLYADKSLYGECMIPVSGLTIDHYGIDNAIVFVKGTIEVPNMTRVVLIQFESETEIEIVREYIINNEKQYGETIAYAESIYGEEVVIQFSKRDLPDYREYSHSKRRDGGGNSGRDNNQMDGGRKSGGGNTTEIDESVNGIDNRDSKVQKYTVEQENYIRKRLAEKGKTPTSDDQAASETRAEAEMREAVAEKEPSFLQKILDRIRAMRGKGEVGEKLTERQEKAERLFTEALREVGYDVRAGRVIGVRDREEDDSVRQSRIRLEDIEDRRKKAVSTSST